MRGPAADLDAGRAVDALAALAQDLEASRGRADFFGRLTALAAGLIGASKAVLWAIQPGGATLRPEAGAHNFVPGELRRLRGVPCKLGDGSPADRIVNRGQSLLFPDPQDPRAGLHRSFWAAIGARDAIGVPWSPGERPRGALLVVDATRPGGFTADDVWLLRLASFAAGMVWQHRQSEERVEAAVLEQGRRVRDLTLMHDTATSLVSTLDVGTVHQRVVEAAARLFTTSGSPPSAASLLLLRSGDRLVSTVHHDEAGSGFGGGTYSVRSNPLLARALTSPGPLAVAVDAGEPGLSPASRLMIGRVGIRAAALAPLRAEGQPIGLLAVAARRPDAFEGARLSQLGTLASLADLAIANARHHREVLREGERLAALEQVKSEFLRLASHELRGPVAIIRGYLSMLADGSLEGRPDLQRRAYAVLTGKAAQMDVLISQVLEAARLEEGRLDLDLRPLDLGEVVAAQVEQVKVFAPPTHSLSLDPAPGPVPVHGDPVRLGEMITNLLDNAIKYSPGGGAVTCRLRRRQGWAVVEVTDQGLGIAPQDMDRLFTRFGRIVTPENSHIAGTGLGLYLARELAERHGGELVATSQPGAGSTFRLRLPIKSPPPAEGEGRGGGDQTTW